MSDNSQYLSAFCFRDNIHKHTSGAYACLAILSRIAGAKFPADTLSCVKILLAVTWAPNALKKAFNSSRREEEGLGRKVNRFLPTLSHGLTEGGRLGQRLLPELEKAPGRVSQGPLVVSYGSTGQRRQYYGSLAISTVHHELRKKLYLYSFKRASRWLISGCDVYGGHKQFMSTLLKFFWLCTITPHSFLTMSKSLRLSIQHQ